MPKYDVTIERITISHAVVSVEAEDADDAEDLAADRAEARPGDFTWKAAKGDEEPEYSAIKCKRVKEGAKRAVGARDAAPAGAPQLPAARATGLRMIQGGRPS